MNKQEHTYAGTFVLAKDAGDAIRKGSVQSQINDLRHAAETCHTLLAELRDRLEPVLRYNEPGPVNGNTVEERSAGTSPMTEDLIQLTEVVDGLSNRTRELLERLEI